MIKKTLCLFLFSFLFTLQAKADVKEELKTPENTKILTSVEHLLSSIKTFESDFVQYNSLDEAHLLNGTFYLSRPNKMRLIYKPPVQLEFIADGNSLIYLDKSLDQATHIPLNETPAALLLKEGFRFSDPDFLVTDVRSVLDDYEITAVKKDNPSLGSITLVVSKKPMKLRQWDVVDMQGVKTSVALYNIKQNIPVDEDLFKFKDPRIKKKLGALNQRGK